MRKAIVVFALILGTNLCFGQYDATPRQIDSMLSKLKITPNDSSKTPLLVNLWRAHVNRDIDKAFDFANQLIDLGKLTEIVQIQHTGYQRMGIAYSYIDDYENSNTYYRKAIELSKKHQEYSSTAAMQINIAMNHSLLNQHDSTLLYAEKSANNFLKENDSTGYASCQSVISGMYHDKGQYRLSLEFALKSIRINKKYKDERNVRSDMSRIALNYLKMNDTMRALEYYQELIELNKEVDDKHGLIYGYAQLGSIYTQIPDSLTESKRLLNMSLELSQEMNNKVGLVEGYYWLGKYALKLNDYVNAKSHFNASLELADSLGQIGFVIDNQLQLGQLALLENNTKETSLLANSALQKSIEKEALENQVQAYELLASNSAKQGNYEASLNYYSLFKKINDSIYNIKNGQRLSELQTIYETEKKEAEIALQEKEITTLNQKVEISNLRNGLYAGGMASALALFGLSVFGFRQRIKKNRIAREKQEEIYRQEIEHKKKELTSQTLHLVQKNTFIQELKENLENLKSSPDKFKTEFRRIVMLLKKENASDKDWEVFKTYFADVHNDFDQKLKTIYGDISEKEIRLAAFLRMNLTTKEIAATLNVLPDSILKSKYRLKKKLNLDKETDLNQFLNAL